MEIAFVSSNRFSLEIEKLQLSFTSRVLKNITINPSRFIASMLLGNNIALVVYGIFMGERILHFFPHTILSGEDPSLIVVFYQTLLSTGIILLTAEFLPKVFFQLYSKLQLKYLLFQLLFLLFILSNYLFNNSIHRYILSRFFKTNSDKVQLSFSKVELGNFIEEQVESIYDKDNLDSEIKIFQNALEFSDVRAKEAMVPRAELVAVDQNTPVEELKSLFIETGLSKIPVYKNLLIRF